jgi:hypothetical protein
MTNSQIQWQSSNLHNTQNPCQYYVQRAGNGEITVVCIEFDS